MYERKSKIPIELHGFYKKGEKARPYRRPHHDVQGNGQQLNISKCVQRKDLIFQKFAIVSRAPDE